MSLHLTLFGPILITDTVRDQPCHLPTAKSAALLAYLAVESAQPHNRLAVASLLWPDITEEKALSNLRQTLHRLRQSLKLQIGPETASYIVSNRLTVQAQLGAEGADWWADAPAFSALIAATRQHVHGDIHTCLACQAKLAAAVALYRGELLESFYLKDAGLFEAWLTSARACYHQQAVQALRDLLAGCWQRGDYPQVITYARRMVQLEPLQQEGWRALMQALVASGERHTALAEYERCRQLFAEQLAMPPSAELAALQRQIQANESLPAFSATNPYKGLQTFTEADAPYFFGREETVEQLTGMVADVGFVAVVAPSGGGKSSLVNAGLLPRLRENGWCIAACRPGDRPLANLTEAAGTFSQALDQTTLLVVDQFEEIFASVISQETRRHFLAKLLDRDIADAVVITLRADFVGNAIDHRPLADALQIGTLLLGPMNQQELRRAIIEPARKQGVTLEGGLVDRLLHDVGMEAGHLPLLEFALLQLWESRDNRHLTHIAYESVGRLDGALTNYADGVYQRLDPGEQANAKTLFLRMVQTDQHVKDMRRPFSRTEVSAIQWSVAVKLADARLLVTSVDKAGMGKAELVHEVLVRYWDRFRVWLDADRAFRVWLDGLQVFIRQWKTSSFDEGALLRGAPLSEAERWTEERGSDLPPDAQHYLHTSLELRAQQLESEIRRQQRERSHTLALAAQLALANNDPEEALSLALASNQIDDPPLASRRILSEAAYAPGTYHRYHHHKAAVLDLAFHPDGLRFLSASADGTLLLWQRGKTDPLGAFDGHQSGVYCVAFAPDGETAISGDQDGALLWWHVESGRVLTSFHDRQPNAGAIRAVAFLPDGRGFLAAGDDGIVRQWVLPHSGLLPNGMQNNEPPNNELRGRLVSEFRGHRAAVYTLAISTDGRLAASGGVDHNLILWDLDAGVMEKELTGLPNVLPLTPQPSGHFSPISGVVFTPDGTQLLAADDAGWVFLWDIDAGAVRKRVTLSTSARAVDVSGDGQWAAVGTMDSQIFLVNLAEGEITLRLKGHQKRVGAVVLADGDRTLYSGAADGDIRQWDLRHGAEQRYQQFTLEEGASIVSFDLSPDGKTGLCCFLTGDMALWSRERGAFTHRWHGHDDMIAGGCRFSPDGTMAVTGSGDYYGDVLDSSVRVWEVATGTELHCFRGHTRHLRRVAMAPNQRFVLSAGSEGKLWYWSLTDEDHRLLWDVAPQSVLSVAISPDSRRAVVGLGTGDALDPDTTIHLFDLTTGTRVRRFIGHTEGVMDLAFAPDGSFFLSAGYDNLVCLWDMDSGERRHTLLDHRGAPLHVAISPSGRLAVSSGLDTDIILWDLLQGEALRRWRGHRNLITSLNFTPDGRSVISTALDNTLRVWRVDATQEILLEWVAEHRYVSEYSNELKSV